MQQLYERIRYLGRILGVSLSDIAKNLELLPQTFNGYLKESRQDNLWPHLPRLLQEYPRVSRQWLYFGEGPVLVGMGIPLDQPVPPEVLAQATHATEQSLRTQLDELAAALDAERRKRAELEGELNDFSRENRALTKQLLAAKDELLAAKERIIKLTEARAERAERIDAGPFLLEPQAQSVTSPRTASGVPGAAVPGQSSSKRD